jgi:site-specific DNA recombinase
VPALELEKAVAEGVACLFDDPLGLAGRAGIELRPDRMASLQTSAQRTATKLRKRDRTCMRALIDNVTVERDRIAAELDAAAIAERMGLESSNSAPPTIAITIDARIRRTGLSMRLVHDNGRAAVPEPHEHLERLFRKAMSWWREMVEGKLTVTQMASNHAVSKTYVSRVVRLNFLAPKIVESILAGNQPAMLDAKKLLTMHDLALDWSDQEAALRI